MGERNGSRTDFFSLLSFLSLTLCFLTRLPLGTYLCTTDNSGARVESQQGNPLTGQLGPESSHVMEDEDGEKRARFFEDKKREREKQLKERKKRLDGSDSEGNEGSMEKGEQVQMRAYDSLTLLGTTTCNSPSQTKGTPETERISSELNKIELNKSTNSPLKNENIKQTDSRGPQVNTINRSGSLTDDTDDIELGFISDEEDSLVDYSHMQETPF